jgi:hypothetical protein
MRKGTLTSLILRGSCDFGASCVGQCGVHFKRLTAMRSCGPCLAFGLLLQMSKLNEKLLVLMPQRPQFQ